MTANETWVVVIAIVATASLLNHALDHICRTVRDVKRRDR